MIYLCVPCDAYVGTHKNSKDHKPLGFLANRGLREARKAAHLVLINCGKFMAGIEKNYIKR
jgi:hypothetical protein